MRFKLFLAIGVAAGAASAPVSAGQLPELRRLHVTQAVTETGSITIRTSSLSGISPEGARVRLASHPAATDVRVGFTISPPVDLLLYDNAQGRLVNGWADCSSPEEFAHYDMPGMNGLDEFVLHTETQIGGFLGFCKAGGISTAGYNALDFYVFPDWNNTGQNVDMAFRTSGGQTVTRSIDNFIAGGATRMIVGQWNHIVVPFSSLGLPNSTLDRIQFIGMSATKSLLLFDEIKLTPGAAASAPSPPSNVRIVR
jgi:hypothetical protein